MIETAGFSNPEEYQQFHFGSERSDSRGERPYYRPTKQTSHNASLICICVSSFKKMNELFLFLDAFSHLAINHNGTLLATVCMHDKSVKIFDVPNFDMINMLNTDFAPKTAAWIHQGYFN